MASTRLWYLAIATETTRWVAKNATKFLAFKEWDINYNLEIIENNPIQNNRRNAINAVAWKVETDWSYKIDVDPKNVVRFLIAAMWKVVTENLDWDANKHTIDTACKVWSLTIEQWKWELCGDPTENDWQEYQVNRAFGCMIDEFKISGSDSILEFDATIKAHGSFQIAKMISNPATVNYFFDVVEWLIVWDAVKLHKANWSYENLEIATINPVNNSLTFAVAPSGTFVVADDVKLELIPKTPSFQDPVTNSFADVDVRFGSDIADAYTQPIDNMENWEITYMNSLDVRYWSLRKSPSKIAEKWNSMKLSYERYFENVKDRDMYLSQQKRACVISISNQQIIDTAHPDHKYSIVFELSDLRFTNYEMATWTDEVYAVKCEASAFYDGDDGRAVRVIVQNNNDNTYYV